MKVSHIFGALAGMVSLALPAAVTAQNYPDRPVRVIVGLAPGGGTDTVTRLLTTRLAEMLGQSFIVDNRPSSGGNLAGELTARAAPDGHTLLTITPTHVVNPYLFKDIRFDALKDFSAISSIVFTHYVLSVRNTVSANSVKELIALAKTQKLNYASTGIGSANHLSGELFKTMAGIDMSHVPYKGGGPALNALLAGEIQVMFTAMGGVIPHVKAGRVRALGVTGTKRALAAPDIPTIAEAGVPGYDVTGWYGLAGPARIPGPIIAKLNQATVKAIGELKDRYLNIGLEASPSSPAEFGAFLRSESEKWGRVVKLSGAKVD
jgi:tripartite-type tricarboxylate transporter receptor subunit TctC